MTYPKYVFNNNVFIQCFPPCFSSGSNTPYVPLLSWKKAQDSVPWNIIMLLGGGFAMAKGCEVNIVHCNYSQINVMFKVLWSVMFLIAIV